MAGDAIAVGFLLAVGLGSFKLLLLLCDSGGGSIFPRAQNTSDIKFVGGIGAPIGV